VSSWDVSSAEDVEGMFVACDAFNRNCVATWNLSDDDRRRMFVFVLR